MAESRRGSSNRIISRYGICLHDGCSKASSKEIQEIPSRKDFVCEECGSPLRECTPPKSWWDKNKKMAITALGAVAIIGIVICFIMIPKNESNGEPLDNTVAVIKTDTPKDSATVVEEQPVETVKENNPVAERNTVVEKNTNAEKASSTEEKTTSAKRSLDLGYATFKGRVKNGMPHDENGRMVFKEKHLIDKRDSQKRVAEPGDYIIGEYVDGKLVQGVWYNEENIVKGSIIIGL